MREPINVRNIVLSIKMIVRRRDKYCIAELTHVHTSIMRVRFLREPFLVCKESQKMKPPLATILQIAATLNSNSG